MSGNFSALSPEIQNILMYSYESAIKYVLVFGLFIFACFYLFYWKPVKEKPTIFWSSFWLRMFLTAISFFSIILFPLTLLLLNPNYDFGSFLTLYLTGYLLALLIFGIIAFLDFWYWGLAFVVKIGGLDMNSDKYSKFKRWVDTYLGHRN